MDSSKDINGNHRMCGGVTRPAPLQNGSVRGSPPALSASGDKLAHMRREPGPHCSRQPQPGQEEEEGVMGQERQPELPSSSPGLETPSIALALGPAFCRSLGRWPFAEGPMDTEDSPALQPQAQHGRGYLSASRTRSLASASSGCRGCDSLLLCLGQRHEKGGDLQPPPSCGTTMIPGTQQNESGRESQE
ncbi:unnamed protein product [Caretta caretta]